MAQTFCEHLIEESEPMKLTVLAARTRQSARVPPSVRQFVTDDGDILPQILLRQQPLPPCPPMPRFGQASAPSVPDTITQALSSNEAIYWLHSIVFEFRGHMEPVIRQPTFEFLQSRPPNSGSILHGKWAFTHKFEGDQMKKFKARLCVAGWGLTRGVDFLESYTETAPIGDLWLLQQLALLLNLQTFELDLTQAYCHARMPSRPQAQDEDADHWWLLCKCPPGPDSVHRECRRTI